MFVAVKELIRRAFILESRSPENSKTLYQQAITKAASEGLERQLLAQNAMIGFQMRQGDYAQAMRYITLELFPDRVAAFSEHVLSYLEKLPPTDTGPKDLLMETARKGSKEPEIYERLAVLFMKEQNFVAARKNFLKAESLRTEAELQTLPALQGMGELLYQRGNEDAARLYFEKALHIPALKNLSNEFKSRTMPMPLFSFQKALDEKDFVPLCVGRVFYRLGTLAYDKGNAEAALAYFDAAGKVLTENPDIIIARCAALMALGRKNEAQKDLENLEKISPQNPLVLNNLGVIEYSYGRYEEAHKYFSAAYEISPGDWNVIHNYALSVMQQGDYEVSKLLFKQVIDKNPPPYARLAIHFNLGVALQGCNDNKAAFEEFGQARNLVDGLTPFTRKPKKLDEHLNHVFAELVAAGEFQDDISLEQALGTPGWATGQHSPELCS